MAWTPLLGRPNGPNAPNGLNGLPRVLAGPILRRVEKNSASVWIACREAFTAQLFVGPALGSANQKLDIKLGSTQLNASPPVAQSVKLGSNLHVALASATPTSLFSAGKVYQYSLRFVFGASTLWLDAATVLSHAGGLASLTYGNMPGPTFVLPAAAPGDLKFAHASCRKPHGGKIDAMVALDTVLAATNSDPAKRPQQLFLTGDQIYADDVDPTLLYMLMDASRTLVNLPVPENAPVLGPENKALATNDPRAPGNRQQTVYNAKLTSDDGDSHLFYLGEFYAMYAFAWSAVLWPPAGSFPKFGAVHPNVPEQVPVMTRGADGPRESGKLQDSKALRAYKAGVASLELFLRDLPKVRKALANIPSYMVFDDHEVTDDWFLNKQWCIDTLADGSLSRRLMQNALAAFAVFQGWGNIPAQFESGQKGRALLALLEKLAAVGAAAADWSYVGAVLLPSLDTATGDLKPPASAPKWHFNVDFGTYRLIVLDTRTLRGFSGREFPAWLIAPSHLLDQLPNVAVGNFALIISPAPIVGFRLAESFFKSATDKFSHYAFFDFEAWSSNKYAFARILLEMCKYEHVVILSGDVHYGFSNFTWFWKDLGGVSKNAVFVQLCSSAAKHTNWKPAILESVATSHMTIPARFQTAFAAYQKPTGWFDVEKIEQAPKVHSALDKPAWQYRIFIAEDPRLQPARGFPAAAAGLSGAKARSQEQRKRLEAGQKIVVAQDNMGFVSFDWVTTPHLVLHDLHWSPAGPSGANAPAPAAHTRHELWLSRPTPSNRVI